MTPRTDTRERMALGGGGREVTVGGCRDERQEARLTSRETEENETRCSKLDMRVVVDENIRARSIASGEA